MNNSRDAVETAGDVVVVKYIKSGAVMAVHKEAAVNDGAQC